MSGSRRGQRQAFGAGERVRFGRHPECEVSFDAHRDLDASSRHAELVWSDGNAVLVDVGSSNGTLVDGARITELELRVDDPRQVEFGTGGPRVQIVVTDADEVPLPEGMPRPPSRRLLWVIAAVALLGAVAATVVALR